MCDNCVYKKSFYQQQNACNCAQHHAEQPSQQQLTPMPEQGQAENIQQDVKADKTFFEIVSPKIDELFEMHPPCEELNSLISSSRWVKVIVDESEKYYIGVIYENSQPKYIAYAVDGVYSKTPPKQLEPNAQWLPVNSLFPESEGYWLMFQDALTGE